MTASFIKFPFTLLIAAVLTACANAPVSVPEPARQKPSAAAVKPAVRFPIRSLTADDAASLVINEPASFRAASQLAALRPPVRREIAGFKLEVFSADSGETNTSEMRFAPLPGGLGFMSHAAPATKKQTALHETAIDLFGVGSLLYWNSRFPYPDGIVARQVDDVRLVSGRLFAPDSPFSLKLAVGAGEFIVQECAPHKRIHATEVHPALTGKATIYLCKASDMEQRFWYLEDAARYVNSEFLENGSVTTRFKIVDVMY